LGMEMQASGGKLVRKSNKITQTPAQDISAEVTPSAKKWQEGTGAPQKEQTRQKQGIDDFFWPGTTSASSVA
jgi:hypothetical protein